MRIRRASLSRATHEEERRSTAVFLSLGRLLALWRDDPERLAVAAWAYEHVLGYSAAAHEVEYFHPDRPMIPREEAHRRVEAALYRRNRRVLQARAEGLVLALRELAEDAEAWRLHGVREEAAVIECRELPIEERLAKLRAMDAKADAVRYEPPTGESK